MGIIISSKMLTSAIGKPFSRVMPHDKTLTISSTFPVELMATEFLPPSFDENKKYAVHFEV